MPQRTAMWLIILGKSVILVFTVSQIVLKSCAMIHYNCFSCVELCLPFEKNIPQDSRFKFPQMSMSNSLSTQSHLTTCYASRHYAYITGRVISAEGIVSNYVFLECVAIMFFFYCVAILWGFFGFLLVFFPIFYNATLLSHLPAQGLALGGFIVLQYYICGLHLLTSTEACEYLLGHFKDDVPLI